MQNIWSFIPSIFYPLSPFISFFHHLFPLCSFFPFLVTSLHFPPIPSIPIPLHLHHFPFPFVQPSLHLPFHPLSSTSSPPSILFPPSYIFPILRPGYIPACWGSRLMCHAGDYGTASSIAALPASLRSRGAMGRGDGGERNYGNCASFWASSCQVRVDILGARLTGDAADSVCSVNGCLEVSIRIVSHPSLLLSTFLVSHCLYSQCLTITESYLHRANIT